MNNRILAGAVMVVGLALFKSSDSVTIVQGNPSDKRRAIVGIVTAGSGLYLMGRADGYSLGAEEATETIITFGRFVSALQ